MSNLNVSLVVKHVNNILENTLCPICDGNTSATRLRYSCGHVVCSYCVPEYPECLICLKAAPIYDETHSRNVSNALLLLKSLPEAFSMDSNEKKRLSEQIRVEKEIFPGCIQAPIKYYNKRKSLLSSFDNYNKENDSKVILKKTNMNRINYVQEWLNQHDNKTCLRKPFLDLNVNNLTQSNRPLRQVVKKRVKKTLNKTKRNCQNTTKDFCRKKSFNQQKNINLKKEKTDISNYNTNVKTEEILKQDRDESGIFIDDESIVVIDESQILPTMDKDELALMAIEERERELKMNTSDFLNYTETANYTLNMEKTLSKKLSHNFTSSESSPLKQSTNNKNFMKINVPYYKKNSLLGDIDIKSYKEQQHKETTCHKKDFSIIISSNTLITTVKVTQNNNQITSKVSVPVQTDITLLTEKKGTTNLKCNILKDADQNIFPELFLQDKNLIKTNTIQSQDVFSESFHNISKTMRETKTKTTKDYTNKDKMTVINDSDSDSDTEIESSSEIQVTAEIHRSCDQFDYDILAEIENESKGIRKYNRLDTPNSTDSSEKENYDPNRSKRIKLGKKKHRK